MAGVAAPEAVLAAVRCPAALTGGPSADRTDVTVCHTCATAAVTVQLWQHEVDGMLGAGRTAARVCREQGTRQESACLLSSLTRSDTLPGPARWLCLGLANVLGRLGRLRMLEAAGPANCADSCHASGWELRMPGRLLAPCTPGSSTNCEC